MSFSCMCAYLFVYDEAKFPRHHRYSAEIDVWIMDAAVVRARLLLLVTHHCQIDSSRKYKRSADKVTPGTRGYQVHQWAGRHNRYGISTRDCCAFTMCKGGVLKH